MQIQKQKKLIKAGDTFQLGKHTLLCGDCRDKKLIDKFIGNRKVSLVLADPPYGVNYIESKSGFKQRLGNEKTIANDQEQSEEEYKEFTKEWLEIIKVHLTKKNSIYIFNSDRMIFSLRQAMLESKFKFSQLLIWVKNTSVIGRLDYLPQHELVAYGWYGTHKFIKSKDKSVIFYPKPSKSKLHPTMKPVGLLRKLILNSSEIGDVVYDCFGGSGSTLIASEQTKRNCLMVELDPEYCQTIINRWERLTGKKAKKLNKNI